MIRSPSIPQRVVLGPILWLLPVPGSHAATLRPPSLYLTGQEDLAIVAEARVHLADDRILFARR